jgi:shikimate kinase
MIVRSHIIYIIGFMGSGKTTIGRELALKLNWSFTDLDKKIEEYAGKSIPEIFSQKGEGFFREIETKVLESQRTVVDTVISTGGGTPCHGDNMKFMLDTGLTIYLKLSPAELETRLSDSRGERPLIMNLDKGDLKIFIERKLADREKWYDRSEIIIGGINPDIDQIVHLVRFKLNI